MKNSLIKKMISLACGLIISNILLGGVFFSGSAAVRTNIDGAQSLNGNTISLDTGIRFDDVKAPFDPNAADAPLAWNTFLGGPFTDRGNGVAADNAGNIYVCGEVPDNVSANAFVARLDAASGSLVWSAVFGGISTDAAGDCVVDTAGNLYVAGFSNAAWGTPVRPYTTGSDGFVARLNPANGAIVWSTFIGGNGADFGYQLDGPDANGNLFCGRGKRRDVGIASQSVRRRTGSRRCQH